MANETFIPLVGNLTADPELRFTPNGAAVANFTVASTPRNFDRQANEWKDGEAMFLRCSVWREAAENVAESLTKGMRVIVYGHLKARSYQDREGNNRTAFEVDVLEVGPALKYATAKVTRSQRGQGGGGQTSGGGFGGGAPQGGQGGGFGGPAAAGQYGDQNAGQGGGQPQQGGGFPGPGAQGGGWQGGGAAQDPWAGAGGWDTPQGSEPPF